MICCEGQYCFALVNVVFLWLFNLCKNYLYSEYIFMLVVNQCVFFACVLCGSFPYTTPQEFFALGPGSPNDPTGIYIVPSPPLFSASGSPLAGRQLRGLKFLWCEMVG